MGLILRGITYIIYGFAYCLCCVLYVFGFIMLCISDLYVYLIDHEHVETDTIYGDVRIVTYKIKYKRWFDKILSKEYYKINKENNSIILHRLDGPAVITKYKQEWHIYGKKINTVEIDDFLIQNRMSWPLTEDQQLLLLLQFA